jgi:glycosyltransferase involved in cell wall biosynthesis
MKPLVIFFAPVATRSGYGEMARDIIRHFIEYDKFDVQIFSAPWGDTPMNALDENNPRDKMLIDRIIPSITKKPEVFVHVGIPSEARPIGKYNILCTAGIETTAASAQWVEAANKMDLILAISQHAKQVLQHSKYKGMGANGTEVLLEITKPIEVLHNCVDTTIFGKGAPTDNTLTQTLNTIPENFCFLFVGHWLRGDYGEDRKNVAMLIKLFLETFRQVKTKHGVPALILKTSTAGFSIIDREQIVEKIEQIKSSVKLEAGQVMPNIYLLHGELTEKEMNTIYTHPKVKAHISLTKGEGFGRPLLEASVSGKPVIASGWSGHLDFLDKDRAMLIGGELKPVHESSVWENIIIKEASWFSPDVGQAMNGMAAVAIEYKTFKDKAYQLALENKKKFSYETVREKTFELLDKYLPEFPREVSITLPKLKKVIPASWPGRGSGQPVEVE